MFEDQFGEVEGIRSLPLDCIAADGAALDLSAIDELVEIGRRPGVRAANRAHALRSQDLAHRVRQILARLDIAEPHLITERFDALDAARTDLLRSVGQPA